MLKAVSNIVAGLVLGLLLFYWSVKSNPQLMLRGMALLVPREAPVSVLSYPVHLSDGDLFYWQGNLVQKPEANEDRLVAQVTTWTDEFGFPNQGPLPAQVDWVVLGRSFSIGAQTETPWHQILATENDLKILNLSQTGSDIGIRTEHLTQFGLPRNPDYVISEITPALDVIGYSPGQNHDLLNLSVAMVFTVNHQLTSPSVQAAAFEPLFPLLVDLPNRQVALSIYLPYLQALTIDARSFEYSQDWQNFREASGNLIRTIRDNDACSVLLYTPTKSDVYLPLLQDPNQFSSVLSRIKSWKVNEQGRFVQSGDEKTNIPALIENSRQQREYLARYASEQGALFVDPTDAMIEAVLGGVDPFLDYDTHWSQAGHQIVAHTVYQAIHNSTCP